MADQVNLNLGIGGDFTDFARFTRALRKAKPEVAKLLRMRLRTAGKLVADDAKVRASEHSQSIPPSIKIRTSGMMVAVIAGGEGVPLAGLYELGNKPNRRNDPTSFRHPLFGNKNIWYSQQAYPFLAAAVRDHIEQVEFEASLALAEAIQKVVSG